MTYLLSFCVGCFGFWSLQSGLRKKSHSQKMQEARDPSLAFWHGKEKNLRIYIGAGLLVISVVIFFN
jgi:hypothetical protein